MNNIIDIECNRVLVQYHGHGVRASLYLGFFFKVKRTIKLRTIKFRTIKFSHNNNNYYYYYYYYNNNNTDTNNKQSRVIGSKSALYRAKL